ncbi:MULTISPECIES: TolC family protein [Alteromonas]|uniref:TolC family protein n=1 Tax=Alteromonas TaxID=226 RepID=UPI000286CEA7|nr:efflux transporter outer membrane subunit [Alteromonas macleodii]AFT94278.1 NodT family RND efflux system outer membrane lipoprotein [Alteromonas macleodii str. 'Balearic Sea AD45']
MTNKKRFTYKPLWLALSSALLVQACATPTIETRNPKLDLPEQFNAKVSQVDTQAGQGINQSTQANIQWSEWFNDPTLSALVETAVKNNQEVSILIQRINMASNEVYAREGEYLPRLSAGGAAETEKVGEYTREGAVEEQLNIKEDKEFPDPLANLKLGLNASWEIDVWHKLRDASKVASLEYLASVESKNFFVTQLVSEVARTYYELLALDNKLENLDSTISLQRNVIHTINALKEYGRASSLPVARFNAEVKKNESERYLIEQEILEKENTLNLLLGRTPQPIQRDSNVLLSAELKSPQVGVPSALLDNRPDIKQAALTLQAAELNIDVAKANFYPSFELKAGVGLSAFDSRYLFNVPESLAYSLSGDVFAPLINRRAIEAVYQNASAEQIEAAYEYELTVLKAVAEVTNSLSKLDNLEKSAEARRHQIASLEQSIDIANRLFSSAHGEYLEVLLAQREALEARSEFIETRQQQMAALVDLYQALGGGWQS